MLHITFNPHIHVHTKEYLNHQFKTSYICNVLHIYYQIHLLIRSVIVLNPYNLMCQKRVEI
jgi:hypothetical protein